MNSYQTKGFCALVIGLSSKYDTADGSSATDEQRLAGDERGLRIREEHDRARDIGGCAKAACGYLTRRRAHFGTVRRDDFLEHLGLGDGSRRDDVDGHAIGSEFQRPSACK